MMDGNEVFRWLFEMGEAERSQIVFPTYYDEDDVEGVFECLNDELKEAGFPDDCYAADIFSADEMKAIVLNAVSRASAFNDAGSEAVHNEMFAILKEKIEEKAKSKEA